MRSSPWRRDSRRTTRTASQTLPSLTANWTARTAPGRRRSRLWTAGPSPRTTLARRRSPTSRTLPRLRMTPARLTSPTWRTSPRARMTRVRPTLLRLTHALMPRPPPGTPRTRRSATESTQRSRTGRTPSPSLLPGNTHWSILSISNHYHCTGLTARTRRGSMTSAT